MFNAANSQDLSKSPEPWLNGGVGGVTQPGRLILLPMYEHIEAKAREHGVLELGIVVHDDRHNAHVREEAPCPANHVLGINLFKTLFRQFWPIFHL